MDFEKRLERAVERGKYQRDSQGRREAERALSAEELRNMHSQCRLELSEHIENCLRKLADHFPGFQFQSIVSDEGWGAKISRDDIGAPSGGGVQNFYSRLEMLVRPFTESHIVELAAKGTIRNKEILTRNHFQFLSEIDLDSFVELIDLWILEYAEQYSART